MGFDVWLTLNKTSGKGSSNAKQQSNTIKEKDDFGIILEVFRANYSANGFLGCFNCFGAIINAR